MATGGGPMVWRPSALRAFESLVLGPSAARRAARVRRQRACEAALRDLAGGGAVPGGWRDRELAARPALQLRAASRPVPGRTRRRRNAAWHSAAAPACGFARASDADIALAAAGPRLDEGVDGAPSVPPRDLGGVGEIPGSAAGASTSRMRASAATFSPAQSRFDVLLPELSEAPLPVLVMEAAASSQRWSIRRSSTTSKVRRSSSSTAVSRSTCRERA